MFGNEMELLLRVCVFPISSLEFYENNYFEELLKKKTNREFQKQYGKVDGEIDSLQKALFLNMSRRCKIHNIDQLDLLMSKYYGYSYMEKINQQGKNENDIYLDTISQLAKCFVCHRNGRLALKYWESGNEETFLGPYKGINKIALWNSLNRIVSTELIVIQYLIQNGLDDLDCLNGYYSTIMLEDLQLEQILQRGVAETHIHQGASISFLVSWTHLMNLRVYWEAEGKNKNQEYDNEFLNNPYIEKRELRATVKVMAIMRIILSIFLKEERDLNLEQFLKNKLGEKKSNKFEDNLSNEKAKLKKVLYEGWMMDILDGKLIQVESQDEYKISKIWDLVIELFLQEDIYTHQNIQEDIVNFIFKNNLNTSGENIFLFYAMEYINSEGKKDKLFLQFFWQYIRIKNQIFEAKVEFNSIAGLDYFQKYYKRSTMLACYERKDYWKVIMKSQLQNQHLKKLELRCSFPKEKSDKKVSKGIRKNLCSFFSAYFDILDNDIDDIMEPPYIGLVFHLIKSKDEEGIDKCWQNTFKEMPASARQKELYYRKNQEQYITQVNCLNDIREHIPDLDHYILGIDAASIENNTEPWVFASAYQLARDSTRSKMIWKEKKIQTLGFTFHVGEDFRHLLTGLRHIDEVISHFGFHAGDRIGHGIALGINVTYWIKQNPIVLMPREEYLDNLLWVWGVCKDYGNQFNIDLSFLEQQIMKQAEAIYGKIDGITIYILWKVYQNKFEIFEPSKSYKAGDMELSESSCFFCKYAPKKIMESITHWDYEILCYVLHCKCYLERMEEIIQVEVTDTNGNLMEMLQKMLIEKVSNLGIVIETNPTSNLTIGEIPDIFHHYIFNLNEIGGGKERNSVIVSINSDDPSVFNTNVSNEIAYIFYVLQQKGISREDALLWIDKVRQYGMNTSFIKERHLNKHQLKREIKGILEALQE